LKRVISCTYLSQYFSHTRRVGTGGGDCNCGKSHKRRRFTVIKISALYHDVGFIKVYGGHEEESCAVALEELSSFGCGEQQLQKVAGMIRATKVPQIPQNTLEQIICDADLDYLGRNDFFTIGDGLYKEFLYQKIVTDEDSWNRLQVKFLESHHYFTETSKKRRQHEKQRHLEEVKAKLLTSIS
jgi:predicted metal-dependent HD superfamily phosphohydrolase